MRWSFVARPLYVSRRPHHEHSRDGQGEAALQQESPVRHQFSNRSYMHKFSFRSVIFREVLGLGSSLWAASSWVHYNSHTVHLKPQIVELFEFVIRSQSGGNSA